MTSTQNVLENCRARMLHAYHRPALKKADRKPTGLNSVLKIFGREDFSLVANILYYQQLKRVKTGFAQKNC